MWWWNREVRKTVTHHRQLTCFFQFDKNTLYLKKKNPSLCQIYLLLRSQLNAQWSPFTNVFLFDKKKTNKILPLSWTFGMKMDEIHLAPNFDTKMDENLTSELKWPFNYLLEIFLPLQNEKKFLTSSELSRKKLIPFMEPPT